MNKKTVFNITVAANCTGDYNTELHLAIHEKMKELGWING